MLLLVSWGIRAKKGYILTEGGVHSNAQCSTPILLLDIKYAYTTILIYYDFHNIKCNGNGFP